MNNMKERFDHGNFILAGEYGRQFIILQGNQHNALSYRLHGPYSKLQDRCINQDTGYNKTDTTQTLFQVLYSL